MNEITISICIPAYKRVNYLKRLIESIIIQDYTDFEVIISDDSDDDSVSNLVNDYSGKINIRYFKNEKSVGFSGNVNFAISKAKGQWIKLICDDDWFASADSLSQFAEVIKDGNQFIFSAYTNCYEDTTRKTEIFLPTRVKNRIIQHPELLFAGNVIGPPSVTMLSRSIVEQYDEKLKWFVDLEFYIRVLLRIKSYSYINKPLINIGISESQVTKSCQNIPEIELPEGLLILKTNGISSLKYTLLYDVWWRMIRNNKIRSEKDLGLYTNLEEWPTVIIKMVKQQSVIPTFLLKIGAFSKCLMLCSYLLNYHLLSRK
jgi:glycosyltransferase involved in cell wall biosynthesis